MDQIIAQIEEARVRLRAAFSAAAGKQDVQQGIQSSLQELADLQGQVELAAVMNAAANVRTLTGILDKAIAVVRYDISGFLVEDLKTLRQRVSGASAPAGEVVPPQPPAAGGTPPAPGGTAPAAAIPPAAGGTLPAPGGNGPVAAPPIVTPPDVGPSPTANPDRPVISLSPPGLRRVNGPVIMAIQLALVRNGQAIDPDGDFGSITAGALQRWQAANGLPQTNNVTESEWVRLTGCPVPSLFDVCLGVTSDFEGTKFDRVVGNFDDQGLTFGLIGFTLVNGELKALLTRIETLKPGSVAIAFGALYPELMTVLDLPGPQKQQWANTVSFGPNRMEVAEPWKKAFLRIGSFPHARRAQMERARSVYWEKALGHLDSFEPAGKPRTDFDAAFWYDTAVQNSLSSNETQLLSTAGASSLTGSALRERFAQVIADGSLDRWRDDVLTRKRTFVGGTGTVHGSAYDLGAWGLADRSISTADLNAASSIIDLVASGTSGWNEVTLGPDEEASEAAAVEGTASAPVVVGTSPHSAWALYPKFVSFIDGLGLRSITADEILFQGGQNQSGPCQGLNTYPPEELWSNIAPTAAIVDKLRSDLAQPVHLLSIYRSPAYNSCIQGSAAHSQHMQYRAIDFVMDGGNPISWSAKLKSYRASGMFKGGIGVYKTFVHVDTRGYNADWTG
ncbi:D-Ala-D-Ala carboxypeptidase family metallohydrolase [Mesorhizobium sp. ORM16]|uniref:D-Ala-D-Ala carboxypeptidase family metallohydrolase n=1 Tax=Mesorhizobium sp. ORM16 TaxID=3376989 RepID=UPI003857F1A7